MSFTKDKLSNIHGKIFQVVRGVESECLVLGDDNGGDRISGPKPWGGGTIVKTFKVDEEYGPIEWLESENARLRKYVTKLETVNIDITARLADYIGQYDPTDAYVAEVKAENAKLRELLSKVYGYYVSGTLTPCDFCDKYSCEGDAPTTCKSDEYDPDRIVVEEFERRMHELGVEASQ